MELLLKVVDGPSDGSWRGLAARFDPSGGLIGRAETARLSLPDSSRTVSRFHAHVSCSDDTFFLEEMGSRNAATINGKALKAGSKEPLRPGDQVRIGHFLLAVEFDDPNFPATQVIDRPWRQPEPDEEEPITGIEVEQAGAWQGASTANDELLKAFRDGAGIQLDMPQGLRPDFMKMLGQVLRTLAEGVHGLTSQRDPSQEEPSSGKRRSRSRHVDPIRTAAENSRWLVALLKSGENGSPALHAKVQEMIDDLTARLAATQSAAQAAVEQTEARLSPAAVEERLQASLFLDELLPMRRKAQLWDLYRKIHASPATPPPGTEAAARPAAKRADKSPDSRARELFHNAFARAYEAEVSRLRAHRHSPFTWEHASLATAPRKARG